jgi:hypothetical protein
MPQTYTESTAVWGIPQLFEIKLRAYRYRVFCSGCLMIKTCPKVRCLAAEKPVVLFKRPGSFKQTFKKCGNVEEYKAYQMISPMTPLLNGWTIPLNTKIPLMT